MGGKQERLKMKNILPFIVGGVGILIMLLFGGRISSAESEGKNEGIDIIAYAEELEEKIKKLCESCDGVSHVTVLLTLEGGFEYEYAQNVEIDKNAYGEERREEYLVVGQGSGAHCVVLRQKIPEIAGVGIVCRGGHDDTIKGELITLISSALHIGANKIYITGAG